MISSPIMKFRYFLADAYGCRIEMNTDSALAKPLYDNQPQKTYSCTAGNSSTQYEVHVLSVYEANRVHTRPPVGSDATVDIISRERSDRPIILVLVSHEPVKWILNLPTGITISKVILVSTKYRNLKLIHTSCRVILIKPKMKFIFSFIVSNTQQ